MEQATAIGLDIANHVLQVQGADAAGHVLFRKRIPSPLPPLPTTCASAKVGRGGISGLAGCEIIGHWRIVASDLWDREYLDLAGPSYLQIGAEGWAEFSFGAVDATAKLEYGRANPYPNVRRSYIRNVLSGETGFYKLASPLLAIFW
jgi:hypothetical protein